MTTTQLRIDGRWASTIAAWGDLTWSTTKVGGVNEIGWSMDVDTTFRHPALRTGSVVEIFDGPARLGGGIMNEPDLVSGAFVARGDHRRGLNYVALDGSGVPTSIPDVAIDAAIARGLPWTRPASISGSPFGANPPDEPFKISALLDAYTDAAGSFWYLDADRAVRTRPALTGAGQVTPTWYLAPGLTDLGVAEDEYASDLYARRLASGGTFAVTTRGDAAARAAFERREEPVDLTRLGVLTAGQANAILDGLLAKGKARPAFTESIEVSADQLQTLSGIPADLSMVAAGQVVRSHGFYDDIAFLNGATYLDWTIGETRYTAGAPTISLSPQGLAPRDLRSVLSTFPTRTRF